MKGNCLWLANRLEGGERSDDLIAEVIKRLRYIDDIDTELSAEAAGRIGPPYGPGKPVYSLLKAQYGEQD